MKDKCGRLQGVNETGVHVEYDKVPTSKNPDGEALWWVGRTPYPIGGNYIAMRTKPTERQLRRFKNGKDI